MWFHIAHYFGVSPYELSKSANEVEALAEKYANLAADYPQLSNFTEEICDASEDMHTLYVGVRSSFVKSTHFKKLNFRDFDFLFFINNIYKSYYFLRDSYSFFYKRYKFYNNVYSHKIESLLFFNSFTKNKEYKSTLFNLKKRDSLDELFFFNNNN
jgi:hypothetical protein